MIRLCTHCKMVDTQDPDEKYCASCFTKLQRWLNDKAHVEPQSLAGKASQGKEAVKTKALNLYYGRKR